jgi:hypothetical protein
MSARRLAMLAAGLLAGCSAVTPFATFPLQPRPGVTDPRTRVAICYNTLQTSPERVQELAQAECIGNATVEPIDTDYRLDSCPLSAPGRATFACVPKK